MALTFKEVEEAIRIIIKSGHVPNIIGTEGIGKSDLVRGFAMKNNYAYAEITCSLMQEGDLAMPYIVDGEVHYAINKIITKICEEAEKKERGILFLDEFNRASSQVQSELMNLVLQRSIVGYDLAGNVSIILAMNPSSDMEGYEATDYTVSFSDAAILGRLCNLDMVPNLNEWVSYGQKKVISEDGTEKDVIHPTIRKYLASHNTEFLSADDSGKRNTPRGWARASDILYVYESEDMQNTTLLSKMLKGTLQKDSVDLFIDYYENHRKTMDYILIAESTLNADTDNVYESWPKALFSMNDLDLDKVFNHMLEYLDSNPTEMFPDKVFRNFATFVMSGSEEISFAWISGVQSKPAIMKKLIEYGDFNKFMLAQMIRTNERVAPASGNFIEKK